MTEHHIWSVCVRLFSGLAPDYGVTLPVRPCPPPLSRSQRPVVFFNNTFIVCLLIYGSLIPTPPQRPIDCGLLTAELRFDLFVHKPHPAPISVNQNQSLQVKICNQQMTEKTNLEPQKHFILFIN